MRFNIPTQGEADLPLSEPCGDVNDSGKSSECHGRWGVGTYAHLHGSHAPKVLVAIAAERGIFTGAGRLRKSDKPGCSAFGAQALRADRNGNVGKRGGIRTLYGLSHWTWKALVKITEFDDTKASKFEPGSPGGVTRCPISYPSALCMLF